MANQFTSMVNEAIFKARDSSAGKQAVKEHKNVVKHENQEMYNLLNAAKKVKELGESGETRREGHWRTHSANEYGIREFDYDERYNNHILYVDDVNRYSIESNKAFNQSSDKDGSVTVLPYKHSSFDKMATPRERINWDMTYFHEQSHAKGNSGDRQRPDEKYNTRQDWTRRPEEHLAEEGTLEVLKENMDRAGLNYGKEISHQALLDYYPEEPIENPSSLVFRDRMEYLPNPDDDMTERGRKAFEKERVTTDEYGMREFKKIDNPRELQLNRRDEELKRRASGFNIRWGNISSEDKNLNRKLMATKIADDFEQRFIKSTEQE